VVGWLVGPAVQRLEGSKAACAGAGHGKWSNLRVVDEEKLGLSKSIRDPAELHTHTTSELYSSDKRNAAPSVRAMLSR
jgi:hypothetical protein